MSKDIDRLRMQESSVSCYHRGSFVAFLCLIQSRVIVDWQTLMHHVLKMMEIDPTVIMGASYAQELLLYLHVFDIYSAEAFTRTNQVEGPAVGVGRW